MPMTGATVAWSDDVDEVLQGDLTAAVAYVTPAGGAVATAVAPCGLSTRVMTGWLDVDEEGRAVYAPHTSKGFLAPPRKRLLLVTNGLMAKYGLRQARRHGLTEELERLVAARGTRPPEPT